MSQSTEKITAFIFGVVALVAIFALLMIFTFASNIRNKEMVFITVDFLQVLLALGAAGVAGVFSGFLAVQMQGQLGKGAKYAISASGALAVFVIIFFWFKPGERLKGVIADQIKVSRAYDRCRLAVFWDRNRTAQDVQSAAYAYCAALEKVYSTRWDTYDLLSEYHWYQPNYTGVWNNSQKALDLIAKTEEERDVDEFLIIARARLQTRAALAAVGAVRDGIELDKDMNALATRANSLFDAGYKVIEPRDKNFALDVKYYQWIGRIIFATKLNNGSFDLIDKGYNELTAQQGGYGKFWTNYNFALALFVVSKRVDLDNQLLSLLTEMQAELQGSERADRYRILFIEMTNEARPVRPLRAADPIYDPKFAQYLRSNAKFADVMQQLKQRPAKPG